MNKQPMWSSYQMEIFKEIAEGKDNLIIEAVAGSGKTTTIIQSLKGLPKNKRTIFLAFNNSIAKELSEKVPDWVTVKTTHSLGLSIIRDNFRFAKVKSSKLFYILKDLLEDEEEWFWEIQKDLCKIISAYKMMGISKIGLPDYKNDSIGYLSLVGNLRECQTINAAISRCWEFTGEKGACTLDFDDMLAYPAYKDLQYFPQFDYVFVDEAQDLNSAQRILIAKILKKDGKLIGVGDTSQAIYGFRGADYLSLEYMEREFNCKRLSLPITYRCSQSVTELAQKLCPDIQHRKGAPIGSVGNVKTCKAKPGDMVLCRINSPLVEMAFILSKSGQKVCLLGKDLIPRLMDFVRGTQKKFYSANRVTFDRYRTYKLINTPDYKLGYVEQTLNEYVDILGILSDNGCISQADFKQSLSELFLDSPTPGSIVLSTIHKAKGLEANNIYLLRPDLLPHPLAMTAEELVQEDNLHYVAITRAKEGFYYVTKS